MCVFWDKMFENWKFVWLPPAVVLASLYFYFKNKYSYWTNQGVPGPAPLWGIGNVHQRIAANFYEASYEWVKQYGKVYGGYTGTTPFLVIADPVLVKQVLIKDFHYFVNRPEINAFHEMWNKNLFSSNDDEWKRLRTIVSPSFTSGKLRAMNSVMHKCIDNLDQHFGELCEANGVMEPKKTFAGFTIDVIAAAAFATDTHANNDPENVFVINGQKLLNINPVRAIATMMLPTFALKLFGIDTLFPPKPFEFFIGLAKHIVEHRKSNPSSCTRNDLIQLMMDAAVSEKELDNINYDKMTASDDKDESSTKVDTTKESSNKNRKLSESEVVANCLFFFIAGFETTTETLCNCIYELAKNAEIQEKLHYEVHQAVGSIDSDSEEYFDKVITEIPYLEAFIKETLRLYPPALLMNRVCATDGYKINGITLNKGMQIEIPTSAIHLNPEYYPEPKQFRPDRFMPDARSSLVPYAFMPFSLGPRNCIAMRFAYQEIKLCLARIVLKYRLETTPETPKELAFKPATNILTSELFQVKLSKR